jgi:hypothetical protein
MPHTVFFSWQADRPPLNGKDLVERALERATARISEDTTVEKAVRDLTVDRDTKGLPGSPPIVDSIFHKIDKAAVFVPDLTFVGERADGRPTPNPNVMIEYGWALKSLTHARIVPVINTAFGKPTAESMPFDMRHLLYPTVYSGPDRLGRDREHVIEQLALELEQKIRGVLESGEFKSTLPKSSEFRPREPADGCGRFKPVGESVGIASGGGLRGSLKELILSPEPVAWFRLMPFFDPGRTWSVDELERAMKTPFLSPLSRDWGGYSFIRTHEGHGVYSALPEQPATIRAIVFAFKTGEVWSVDTYWLGAYSDDRSRFTVPSEELSFRKALVEYGQFLQRLDITPPFRWIAGMENLKGRVLYLPTRPGYYRAMPGPDGKCIEDIISESGTYSPGDSPGKTLRPFFQKLYDSCGVAREDWRDA